MSHPRSFFRFILRSLASIALASAALSAQIAPPQGNGGGGPVLGGKGGGGNGGGNDDGDGHGHGLGSRNDDPAARLDWWRQRMGGNLTPEFMARFIREAAKQRLLYPYHFGADRAVQNPLPQGVLLPLAVGGTTWTSVGPTSSNKIQNGAFTRTDVNGGRLRSILADSADANTLYLLSAGGGLWKTSNFLSSPPTWTALTDSVGSTAGGSASFGRVTTGAGTVLYVGMGDPFDLNVGGFVVKSTNAGSSWSSAVMLTGATQVLDLKVDTSTANDIVLVGTEIGLFRSINNGATYSAVADTDVNGKHVWSLVKTSAGWIASTETVAGTGAIVLSTDLGATWAPVTGPAGAGRMTLGVGVPLDATVYCFAATTADAAQLDLYFSTNGGVAWTACNMTGMAPTNPNGDQTTMDLMTSSQAFYNQMVLVDPTDGTRNTVYLGGEFSSAYSTNAKAPGSGSIWTLMTNWLPGSSPAPSSASMPYVHADFHCAAFTNVGGTERLLFGTDGGLAVGTNRAGGWNTWDQSKNIGISDHLIYTVSSGPLNNVPCDANSVLLGLQDNGTHNRIGATSVFDQTVGGDGTGVGWSQATNTYAFGSYPFNNIFRCTANPPDDISKWSFFTGGLGGNLDTTSYYFVTPIITAPPGADATGTTFYTYGNSSGNGGSNRVWSTTGGGNWAQFGVRLPNPGTGRLAIRPVSHGLGAHPTDPNRLAGACTNGYVVTTTTAGGAWTARLLGTTGGDGQNIGWYGNTANVEWVDNNTLLACSEATTALAAHVAKSINAGANWTRSDTGLPDVPVTKILCDRGDATGNTLYAATWLGVYRSLNKGASWNLFGTGLPQVRVSDIYLHPNSNFIRASTWGRGVWELGSVPAYTAPVIGTQPVGGAFTNGTPFSLTVAASPSYPTLSYQWRRGGVSLTNGGAEGIAGATTATLNIATPSCASNGNYDVVVTNCANSTNSNVVVMSNGTAVPFIQQPPFGGSYTPGTPFSLSVSAVGSSLIYQWTRNGVNLANGGTENISGATTATLTISNPDCYVSAGVYAAVVSNCAGTFTSYPATMTSSNPGAVITAQPANTQFETGNGFSMSVVATGPGLTYQWTKGGVNLVNGAQPTWVVSGATTATLGITNAQSGTAGTYACRITSSGGCLAISNNASVVWGNAGVGWVGPNIVTNPVDVTVMAPGSASFSIVAGGGRVDPGNTRQFTFQWRRNGVNLTNVAPYTGALATVVSGVANAVSPTLTINPTSVALSGNFDCVVTTTSNIPGPATSAIAVLRVIQYTPATAVSLTPSPAPPVATGTPIVFTAVGSGSVDGVGSASPPSAYQYQFWLYTTGPGYVMVQDYGIGSTYTLPGSTPAGTYGIGVDVRTSPFVLWDTFTAINYLTVTPIVLGPGGPQLSLAPGFGAAPKFKGGASFFPLSVSGQPSEVNAHPLFQ